MRTAIAVALLVAFPVFAADPAPAAVDLELGDTPSVATSPMSPMPLLDVELVPAGTTTAVDMACFKNGADAITWTRAARACESERDGCLTREGEGETGRLKYALLGAGIGVGVTVLVVALIEGVRAATSKP